MRNTFNIQKKSEHVDMIERVMKHLFETNYKICQDIRNKKSKNEEIIQKQKDLTLQEKM